MSPLLPACHYRIPAVKAWSLANYFSKRVLAGSGSGFESRSQSEYKSKLCFVRDNAEYRCREERRWRSRVSSRRLRLSETRAILLYSCLHQFVANLATNVVRCTSSSTKLVASAFFVLSDFLFHCFELSQASGWSYSIWFARNTNLLCHYDKQAPKSTLSCWHKHSSNWSNHNKKRKRKRNNNNNTKTTTIPCASYFSPNKSKFLLLLSPGFVVPNNN